MGLSLLPSPFVILILSSSRFGDQDKTDAVLFLVLYQASGSLAPYKLCIKVGPWAGEPESTCELSQDLHVSQKVTFYDGYNQNWRNNQIMYLTLT